MPFDGAEAPLTRQFIAQRMREILGRRGKNWCIHQLATDTGKHCIMGAYLIAIGRGAKIRPFMSSGEFEDYTDRCDDFERPLRSIGKKNLGHNGAPLYNNTRKRFKDIAKLIDAYEKCGRVPETVDAAR